VVPGSFRLFQMASPKGVPFGEMVSSSIPTPARSTPFKVNSVCAACGRRQRSCVQEELCCPDGWSVVWDGCCARCCQNQTCGSSTCCGGPF
jgi:hypothetical protein